MVAKKVVPKPALPPDPKAIILAVLLTPKETAALLRTTVGTLEQWRFKKKGPRYIKYPGASRVFYRRDDVAQWLAAHTVEVAP